MKNSFYNEGFNIDTDFADSLPETVEEPAKPTIGKELLEWVEVLCFAIIAVVVVFSFIFRVATIDGNSMKNTLHDYLIATNSDQRKKFGSKVKINPNND